MKNIHLITGIVSGGTAASIPFLEGITAIAQAVGTSAGAILSVLALIHYIKKKNIKEA